MAETAPLWQEVGSLPDDSRSLTLEYSELDRLAMKVMRSVNANGVAVAISAGSERPMVCVVSYGGIAPPVGTILYVNSGISGLCIRERRALHSCDTSLDPRVDAEACEQLGIRSLAIAPVLRGSRCVAVIEVLSDRPGTFNSASIKVLEEAAARAAALYTLAVDAAPPQMRGAEQPQRSESESQPRREQSCDLEFDCRESAVGQAKDSRQNVAAPEVVEPLLFLRVAPPIKGYLPWLIVGAILALIGLSAPTLIRNSSKASRAQSWSTNAGIPAAPAQTTATIPVPPITSSSGARVRGDADTAHSTAEMRLLVRAAETGDVAAQNSLARRYADGEGVTRDVVRATAWYIVAASHGDMQAKDTAVEMTHELRPRQIAQVRFDVAKMFMNGVGANSDLVAADCWFSLAKAAGDNRAIAEQKRLEKKMSERQISEARKRAAEWLNSHRSNAPRAAATMARSAVDTH